MPYNPVSKFPDVIAELKEMGYVNEVNIVNLENAVMKVMGLVNEKTIRNTIKVMERLGYVHLSRNHIFRIMDPDGEKQRKIDARIAEANKPHDEDEAANQAAAAKEETGLDDRINAKADTKDEAGAPVQD